jgi:hypothetical protein
VDGVVLAPLFARDPKKSSDPYFVVGAMGKSESHPLAD